MMVGGSFLRYLQGSIWYQKVGVPRPQLFTRKYFLVFLVKILNTLFKPPNWKLTPRNVYLFVIMIPQCFIFASPLTPICPSKFCLENLIAVHILFEVE